MAVTGREPSEGWDPGRRGNPPAGEQQQAHLPRASPAQRADERSSSRSWLEGEARRWQESGVFAVPRGEARPSGGRERKPDVHATV